MHSRETTNTNFIIFVLTKPRFEPMIYRTTRGEHANRFITDAVFYIWCDIMYRNMDLKTRLHDQSFPWKTWSMYFYGKFAQRKLCQRYPVYTIKVWSKFDQSFYPELPFGGKIKDKQNGWMVLIPKRCFDWSSPSKFFTKFLIQLFRVNGL